MIEVKAAAKVVVEAPEARSPRDITGDVTVNGTVTATGEIKSGSILLTTHRHTGVQPAAGPAACQRRRYLHVTVKLQPRRSPANYEIA